MTNAEVKKKGKILSFPGINKIGFKHPNGEVKLFSPDEALEKLEELKVSDTLLEKVKYIADDLEEEHIVETKASGKITEKEYEEALEKANEKAKKNRKRDLEELEDAIVVKAKTFGRIKTLNSKLRFCCRLSMIGIAVGLFLFTYFTTKRPSAGFWEIFNFYEVELLVVFFLLLVIAFLVPIMKQQEIIEVQPR